MSHPDGLPDLFLDRTLGRIKVPSLLRAEGPRLITLAEYYGLPEDEADRRGMARSVSDGASVIEMTCCSSTAADIAITFSLDPPYGTHSRRADAVRLQPDVKSSVYLVE